MWRSNKEGKKKNIFTYFLFFLNKKTSGSVDGQLTRELIRLPSEVSWNFQGKSLPSLHAVWCHGEKNAVQKRSFGSVEGHSKPPVSNRQGGVAGKESDSEQKYEHHIHFYWRPI